MACVSLSPFSFSIPPFLVASVHQPHTFALTTMILKCGRSVSAVLMRGCCNPLPCLHGYKTLATTEPMHNNSISVFLPTSRSNCSFSVNDTQSVGQLNVFSTSKGKPISLAFQKTGADNFQSYGRSVAVGRPLPDGTLVLAVGAPGQSK